MTIPIATSPDVTQVQFVRPMLEGRACVVVGSAPLSTKTAVIEPSECVIAVNGAMSSLPGAADLWVLNSKQQDQPGSPALRPMHKTMLHQGKGRSAGHLLLLRGPQIASERGTLATLDALGCRYQSWSVFDKVTKRWFEGEYCGRTLDAKPCSAGILAVTIALWNQASRVRMVGFSFKPGYHYLPHAKPSVWWRDHVQADKLALQTLQARYGDRLVSDLVAVTA